MCVHKWVEHIIPGSYLAYIYTRDVNWYIYKLNNFSYLVLKWYISVFKVENGT